MDSNVADLLNRVGRLEQQIRELQNDTKKAERLAKQALVEAQRRG
jgi:phage shock protein A